MREFNENLFREKRGTNRRISHDVEDGMVKYLEDLHMLEENIEMMEVQILQSYQQKIKMGK